jgi:hypothetical protein
MAAESSAMVYHACGAHHLLQSVERGQGIGIGKGQESRHDLAGRCPPGFQGAGALRWSPVPARGIPLAGSLVRNDPKLWIGNWLVDPDAVLVQFDGGWVLTSADHHGERKTKKSTQPMTKAPERSIFPIEGLV